MRERGREIKRKIERGRERGREIKRKIERGREREGGERLTTCYFLRNLRMDPIS